VVFSTPHHLGTGGYRNGAHLSENWVPLPVLGLSSIGSMERPVPLAGRSL